MFPDGTSSPKPKNIAKILKALETLTLSPSLTQKAHNGFLAKWKNASRWVIKQHVTPLITGDDADILNSGNYSFTNLASITGGITANPMPDLFDGAHLDDVNEKVRKDLNKIIIPSEDAEVPIAPNFFLEARSTKEPPKVAEWQSMLNGAHGAHIIHALQNYGTGQKPVYDGNAYTFTAVLYYNFLKLYAHHLTAPTKPGQPPGCHATLLKYYPIESVENYSAGRRALRSLRERAK